MLTKELWQDIKEETRWYLESQTKTLTFKRADQIYSQGDTPKGLYIVNSGLIGLTITSATSGKVHLLRFFKQDQFFGHRSLFSEESYHATAVALEATKIKFIPKEALLIAIQKDPTLLMDFVKALSKELKRCETQHVMILENEILARVAQSIVYLKDLHPDHNWTRQEIASFCASTVSTVIKTLSELETSGFILQSGRSIQIIDREGLVSLQDRQ